MSREQLDYLLSLVKGGMLERATTMIEQELAKPSIPTKIVGPNLEEILNAAGFYRGDAVCCNDYEKCIKPCTPKGRWLAEKELAKPEQVIVPFPSFMRKRIEEAIDNAINPKGMSVHDGKATVYAADLQRMIAVIDLASPRKPWQEPVGQFVGGIPEVSQQREWVGLTDADLMKEFGYTDELLRDTAYRVEQLLKGRNT